MVGRAYTMKEMKQIVDYLVEHRAYDEIKGRKMWMDLGSSRILDRTWQSLKETFLKRILPDIHNPYYKLTVEQISSFRQGVDIAGRNRNRLEIQTISDDSSTSDNQRAKEQAINKEDEKTGEEKCSKIQNHTRSSTDTLVLENCTENAEDLQEDPESSKGENAQKSLRDFITYSEPLTPMLQEVLHDFSSDDEPQMQIVEESEDVINTEQHAKSQSPETFRESKSFSKKAENNANDNEQNKKDKPSKIKSLKLKKTRKGTWENKEPVIDISSIAQEKETNNNESKTVFNCKENSFVEPMIKNAKKSDVPDNQSNSTTDTPIPNNQEEFAQKPNKSRTSTESSNSETRKKKKAKSRKRSRSEGSGERKKKKNETKTSPSKGALEPGKETQTFDSHPQATNFQKELGNSILNTQQNCTGQTDDTNISPNVVVEKSTCGGNEGTSQEAGPSNVSPSDINPCLKNVSLFEEQFTKSKYSDSDEDIPRGNDIQVKNNCPNDINHDPETNNKTTEQPNNSDQSKEVTVIDNTEQSKPMNNFGFENALLLDSHSETSNEQLDSPRKTIANRTQQSKEMALENLFGFSSGAISYKRPLNNTSSRRFSQRNKLNSRNQNIDSGSSDEYTTASDSEDDAPPTSSRHNGHNRHFKKPASYDILSHKDSLFVVGRKKIYPLMLRENGALHYTHCTESKDAKEADSYWKAKYLAERQKRAEETIRADELARLLRKAKENENVKEPTSPILQTVQPIVTVNKPQPEPTIEIPAVEPNLKPEQKVKIKFNRNREVELEGQWTNLNPILERMVELFNSNDTPKPKQQEESIQKEKETIQKEKELPIPNGNVEVDNAQTKSTLTKNKKLSLQKANTKNKIDKVSAKNSKGNVKDDEHKAKPDEPVVLSSGRTTPSGKSGADSETYKKVENMEKEIFEKIAEIDKTDQSGQENEESVNVNVTKRKRGRPRKDSSVVRSRASIDTIPVKRASSIEPAPKISRAVSTEGAAKPTAGPQLLDEEENEPGTSKQFTKRPKKYQSDSNLVVKSRSSVRASSKPRKSDDTSKSDEVSIPEDDDVRYKFPAKTKKVAKYNVKRSSITQPSLTSPDASTLGYEDSDVTPPNITKRKKRISAVSLVYRKGSIGKVKRKACPYLADDDSTNDSLSQKSVAAANVEQTLNSEVYRSDSYQILMTKAKRVSLMDKIDENTLLNETQTNRVTLSEDQEFRENNKDTLSVNLNQEYRVLSDELGSKTSEANSSIVSFPLSPELSIVENLSVSKDLISSSIEAPTINETQGNEELTTASPNKYLISDVDVSMPLMAQDCEIQTRNKKKPRNRRATFSESFPQEQYSSESLDQRLRDLLLESAKKITQGQGATMEVDKVESVKKTVVKKRRSSTPHKKKTVQRSKTPNIDPVLEEHTEACSQGGRRSCPPVIHVIPCENPAAVTENNVKPQRGRKKKDVIKVKILRPRSSSQSRETIHTSRISVCTDSGINGTVSGSSEGCQCCDISTELIHNHSDTCLNMDDCVGDSVEFVEDTHRSVISLSSFSIPTEVHSDKSNTSKEIEMKEEFVTPESLCSNARDATNLNSPKRLSGSSGADDVATVYHTPSSAGSFNSLITEDLSDEYKPPSREKWYLLSEDDTNFADARSQSQSCGSVRSNLNKIFTPCAVPNLSTISERSKENDTKTVMNTDTETDSLLKGM